MGKIKVLLLAAALAAVMSPTAAQRKSGGSQAAGETKQDKTEFPQTPPDNANVNRPYDGAVLSVSPPGFCWWRAAGYGRVNYKLFVYDASGKEFFVSKPTLEPVCVPDKVFPAGKYSWVVRAYDADSGKETAARQPMSFTIADGAYPLPYPDMKALLSRVPRSHPKLLFLEKELSQLREKIAGVKNPQYRQIVEKAEKGIGHEVLPDPVFHLLTDRKDYAQKRTDYRVEYHAFGDLYLEAVEPMAFVYMITGERKYGDEVKKHLLRLTELPIGGALELYDSKFDEITLQIADALPRAYDWAYGAFTPAERERMEEWMVRLGNGLVHRMSGGKRDFYFYSGESHDGRIPPYMLNFAMALSHRPEAVAWLDFGITSCLTVYPQWGTEDGGWAEGISYALTYSGRFIPPIEGLCRTTGFNLWERPFYKNFPYFLTYCISPVGEIKPFGDSEDSGVGGSLSAIINSMLKFYAERNNDSELKWWAGLFRFNEEDVDKSMKALVQDLMTGDSVKAVEPKRIVRERVFPGVGWSVMHSNITEPREDMMYIFKSSPFGADSHSHLDQNSFAIMSGGAVLAVPAGSRYPQHGAPFHVRYTTQTLAHNTLMFNGKGQIKSPFGMNGNIFASETTEHIAYAAGDAAASYGNSVVRFDRHNVMIRPSVILVVDDVELAEAGTVEWLLHGKEKFVLDQAAQSLTSNRGDKTMKAEFIAPKNMAFAQDDAWPIDPKEGYPMVETRDPANQWHFTGTVDGKVQRIRIATVITVGEETKTRITKTADGGTARITFADKAAADVIFDTATGTELIGIVYTDPAGKQETMNIKSR